MKPERSEKATGKPRKACLGGVKRLHKSPEVGILTDRPWGRIHDCVWERAKRLLWLECSKWMKWMNEWSKCSERSERAKEGGKRGEKGRRSGQSRSSGPDMVRISNIITSVIGGYWRAECRKITVIWFTFKEIQGSDDIKYYS